MRKILFLALSLSISLSSNAQSDYKPLPKGTYQKTIIYTPVPTAGSGDGQRVVKGDGVVHTVPKSSPKKATPVSQKKSTADYSSANDYNGPAWRRAQEENKRRLTSLENGQRQNSSDIADIRASQNRTEVRLDMIERKVDILNTNLSDAQALQRSAQERGYSQNTQNSEQNSFDYSRHERNQKRFVRGALIVVGAAVLATAGYFIGKGMRDRNMANQPYNPPNPNPTPAPTPNINGGPAGVPVIY